MADPVLAMLGAKNFFDLFGLPHAPVEEAIVRKAYRQLALVVHPDKNPHPSAEEAFKALQAALECLADPDEQARHLDLVLGFGNRQKRHKGLEPTLDKRMGREEARAAMAEQLARHVEEHKARQKRRNERAQAAEAARLEELRARMEDPEAIDESTERTNAWLRWRGKPPAAPQAKPTPTRTAVAHSCALCKRGFSDAEALDKHVRTSAMHATNVAKSNRTSTATSTVPSGAIGADVPSPIDSGSTDADSQAPSAMVDACDGTSTGDVKPA